MVNTSSGKFVVLSICAALFIGHSVSSLSLSDPCGGSSPVSGSPQVPSASSDLPLAVKNIAWSAVETKTLAGLLKNKYTSSSTPRVSPTYELILAPAHLANYPFTRGPVTSARLTSALQSDYDDVSTIIMFMNYTYNMETELTVDMDTFKVSLYSTLCKIKIAADANGQTLTNTITDDVVTKKTFTQTSSWFTRDYMVARDAESYLQDVVKAYKDVKVIV